MVILFVFAKFRVPNLLFGHPQQEIIELILNYSSIVLQSACSYHEITCYAPEQSVVYDLQCKQTVLVLHDCIRTFGVGREHLGFLCTKSDITCIPDVHLCEVLLIHRSILHDITFLEEACVGKDILLLKLLLAADNIPCSIEVCILRSDGVVAVGTLSPALLLARCE